jgi:DNA-binding NtrC family response regulator
MREYASLPRLGPGNSIIADADASDAKFLARWLKRAGHNVEVATKASECLTKLDHTFPDFVLLDLDLPDGSGVELIREIRVKYPRVAVVVLTERAEIKSVVASMQAGAFDYLVKPADEAKLLTVARNAISFQRLNARVVSLEREVKGQGFAGMVGHSQPMKALYRQLDRVAGSDATILIHGESGAGKELVARAIHEHSNRNEGPFVALNCAAIPETLQESELFGHEKGAFTGATERRIGRFEQANGGTILFDEVGELSASLQAKLLRVLQERTFSRVGGSKDIESDVRLLAATHRNLDREVESGRFRADLYYRIAVVELAIPPLRVREGDVALLAHMFLEEYDAAAGRSTFRSFDLAALRAVVDYPWPGNVRELQNAMQRASVLAEGDVICLDDLPGPVRKHGLGLDNEAELEQYAGLLGQDARQLVTVSDPMLHGSDFGEPARPTGATTAPIPTSRPVVRPGMKLKEIEQAVISEVLGRYSGNVSATARELGISRSVLYRKLKKYEIDEAD